MNCPATDTAFNTFNRAIELKGEIMKGQLQDKVAIITGGGTGIGEAIYRKFARAGAKIVVNGLPGDPISDVGNAIVQEGGQAISVTGDVSQEEPARECINAAIQQYGKLDVLITRASCSPTPRPTTCLWIFSTSISVAMSAPRS